MSRSLLRFAFVVFFGLSLASGSAVSHAAPDGRAIYNYRCYFCHGYSGDAKTLAATFLHPPPRDFTTARPEELPLAAIVAAIEKGRPGTAMKSFADVLSPAEIAAVARFVFEEFVVRKATNTRYHTPENGWPEHEERYRAAFPFATGEIPLTRPLESLSEAERAGRRLYLRACVSCHDRGAVVEDGLAWDARPLSYPRNHFSLATPIDAMASASPYALHDRPPKVGKLSPSERLGRKLYQTNCAFCHAADGTGKNWIGQFLEPHPRNLTDPAFMQGKTREALAQTIATGLSGTSMPAWKPVLSEKQIRAIVDYIARAFYPLPEWRSSRK